jgi:hypothetical protein
MSNRIPVERWNRPRSEVLEEHNYKSGQPPFDPFPTVTNVLDAALCPVALLHHILHGNDSALIPVQESFGFGRLFQDFIGFLKPALSDGGIPNDISRIRQEFELFARSASTAESQKCWRFYLERWCSRKLDELNEMRPNSNFFEVSVSNSYIPFTLRDGATRTYPLRGRIDEIDIEDRRLIERTIKGMPNENHPPRLKDYQVWLLWKTLTSIPKSKLPTFWQDVNFRNFSLVVETPYHDFEVAKENPVFEELTHNAYSWIQDLAKGGRSEWEAYNGRACTYLNKMEDCGCLRMCYGRRRPFPTTRTEMRREFRNIYRPLCWQEMWNHDLLQYQLLDLVPDALQSLGYVSTGRIVSFHGREIELELDKKQAQPVLDQLVAGESNSYLIVVGTFHVGFELDASFVKAANERFVMETTHRKLPETGVALILPSDSSVVKQRPWFLSRNVQRDVFSLESWGLEISARAAKQSVIQFMESLFGVKPLRSERNAGH